MKSLAVAASMYFLTAVLILCGWWISGYPFERSRVAAIMFSIWIWVGAILTGVCLVLVEGEG